MFPSSSGKVTYVVHGVVPLLHELVPVHLFWPEGPSFNSIRVQAGSLNAFTTSHIVDRRIVAPVVVDVPAGIGAEFLVVRPFTGSRIPSKTWKRSRALFLPKVIDRNTG